MSVKVFYLKRATALISIAAFTGNSRTATHTLAGKNIHEKLTVHPIGLCIVPHVGKVDRHIHQVAVFQPLSLQHLPRFFITCTASSAKDPSPAGRCQIHAYLS